MVLPFASMGVFCQAGSKHGGYVFCYDTIALTSLPTAAAVADATGKVVACNELWRTQPLLSPEAKKNVLESSSGAFGFGEEIGRRLQQMVMGEAEPFEALISSREDGWFMMWAAPRPLAKMRGLFIMLDDVTEQRQIWASRSKSQLMFESIVLGARDGLWFWDLRSHEVYFSPRWKELLGYRDDELKNEYKTFRDLIYKDDRETFEAFLQQFLQQNCESFEKTLRMRHKDGSYRLILSKGGLIRNSEGKGVRMAGSHTDVTESREAEDRLRLSESRLSNLIRMANEAIIAADEDGTILIFNQAAELLFGYSAKEILGQNLQTLAPEEVREVGQQIFKEFINGTDKRRTLNNHDLVSCQRKDGKRFFASGSVVKSGNPGSQQVTFVLKDNALEEHSAQVQKLEAIGQLAAGVAHEINTPIQYLGDNLEFFRDVLDAVQALVNDNREALAGANGELPHDLDFLLEEAPEALSQARDGVSRVATIVRALKEFSHPSSDDLMPANLVQNLKSTITIACNEWKYHATLETDFEDALESVYCYPGDLNQVFLNLIVNAAHAIASADRGDGGRIVVRTKKNGEMAEITIEDNGTGIPFEAQKRVFEPFFTTKEVGKGTGQGLALAHRIVCEKHHGELFFRTRPGQGTEFVIRIPLDPPVEQEVAS